MVGGCSEQEENYFGIRFFVRDFLSGIHRNWIAYLIRSATTSHFFFSPENPITY